MPIKKIRLYAELRAEGDSTMPQRMEMLEVHKTVLKNEIKTLQEHLKNLTNKINYYQSEIHKQHSDHLEI
jgi:DNA-binding transcriptional MerR regulator